MINVAHLLGRVGKIENTTLSNGNCVTNLSMVTNKKYLKNGEKAEKLTWHNVSLFNRLSEIAEKYVMVGDLIYIQGEIENKKYKGQDGIERISSFIIANTVRLMPNKREFKQEKEYKNEFIDDSDSIPF